MNGSTTPMGDTYYGIAQVEEEFRQQTFAMTTSLVSLIDLRDRYTGVLHHHERLDGRGYPSRLKGMEIPLGSRLIAVADSYDALTTNRPYRSGRTHDEAVAELHRCAGTQFDPQAVHAFCAAFDYVVQHLNIALSEQRASLDGATRAPQTISAGPSRW